MVNGQPWYPRFHSYLITDHTSLFLQMVPIMVADVLSVEVLGQPCLKYRPDNEETFRTDVKFCDDLLFEPPHISCNISRDIWNSSRHLKIHICLFHDFSRSPGWKKKFVYAESRASVFIWKIFDSLGWMGKIRTCRLFLARPAFRAPLRAENVIKGIGAFVIY